MTKTISKHILISSLLIGILVLASNLPAAEALRVIYRGDQGFLTAADEDEVLTLLLTLYPPEIAKKKLAQAPAVQPDLGDKIARVTIKDSIPGELLTDGFFVAVAIFPSPTTTASWAVDSIDCVSKLSGDIPVTVTEYTIDSAIPKKAITVHSLGASDVITCNWHIHRTVTQ